MPKQGDTKKCGGKYYQHINYFICDRCGNEQSWDPGEECEHWLTYYEWINNVSGFQGPGWYSWSGDKGYLLVERE